MNRRTINWLEAQNILESYQQEIVKAASENDKDRYKQCIKDRNDFLDKLELNDNVTHFNMVDDTITERQILLKE